MKKILFIIITFLFSIKVASANTIYNMDIDVYVDENGDASVTEIWDVLGSNGTEWYKGYKNLGDTKLSNFKVWMDDQPLEYKKWNINESLNSKKGYYGINETNNGLELCFGKYDYNKHIFKLKYNLSNLVFNTEDSQVIYFNFIDSFSDVDFQNFSINLRSYYDFPDTLDVWGFGNNGYAYVKDGIISMSNNGKTGNQYVTMLVKFPSNTFKNNIMYNQYPNFDTVLKKAEQGSIKNNYNDKWYNKILTFLLFLFQISFISLPFIISYFVYKSKKYGYINNKVINKSNTPMFRDIPCNKDIYYANALILLNNPSSKKENILGAILLKWIKEDRISINKENKTSLIMSSNYPDIDKNKLEHDLYNKIYVASNDGILEKNELKMWAANHYTEFLNLFNEISNQEINKLKSIGHIRNRINKEECKYKNVMDDSIYKDYKELYGLKLFLEEFSSINTKEAIEVHLWDEYLMFAYLFGIADKVAKQFKNMYPELINNENYVDFDTIVFLNDISISSARAASSARSAAQSYSSGGGGFSSFGGGGGSFGGGGGGGSR